MNKYNELIDLDYDEAIHDYRLVLSYIRSEGGNPLTSLMEHGYTEAVARYIIDKYIERFEK